MNLLIYGGAFDPPHLRHEEFIKILSKLNYDKVLIVPTYAKDLKNFKYSFKDRYNLLTNITKNYANVEVSNVEEKINTSFTYEVVKHFENDNVTLVIGTDQANSLEKWKNYEYLKKNCNFLILTRQGYELKDYDFNYQVISLNTQEVSSTYIRNHDLEDVKKFVSKEVYNFIKEKNEENIH